MTLGKWSSGIFPSFGNCNHPYILCLKNNFQMLRSRGIGAYADIYRKFYYYLPYFLGNLCNSLSFYFEGVL